MQLSTRFSNKITIVTEYVGDMNYLFKRSEIYPIDGSSAISYEDLLEESMNKEILFLVVGFILGLLIATAVIKKDFEISCTELGHYGEIKCE